MNSKRGINTILDLLWHFHVWKRALGSPFPLTMTRESEGTLIGSDPRCWSTLSGAPGKQRRWWEQRSCRTERLNQMTAAEAAAREWLLLHTWSSWNSLGGKKRHIITCYKTHTHTHKAWNMEADLSHPTAWDVTEPMLRSAGPLSCKTLPKPTVASLHRPVEPPCLILEEEENEIAWK